MYKYFLKPWGIIFGVYMLGALSVASDIAQLTSFNAIDFLKNHSPQSFYFLIAGTLLLYFVLVVIAYFRSTQQSPAQERNAGQIISTGDVKDSIIIQIKQDKEG